MIRPILTASPEWLDRHRRTHANQPVFGTHRHPYLHDTIRSLAVELTAAEKPALLDYGCGKGVFLRAMMNTGWFRFVRGYDPAVDAFKVRPAQRYDMVICLDVLDQTEDAYVDALIADVAQFAGRIALFDVITVQTPALAHLNPKSAETWETLIGRHMRVTRTQIRPATPDELAAGACPERTIIFAEPNERKS